jgi:prolyl 4-hydroxylase
MSAFALAFACHSLCTLIQTIVSWLLRVECGRRGLAVKPRKGMALLFWSLKPDSKTKDMRSLHGGCPVIRGDKWSATK